MRKINTAFGALFTNITLVRYNSNGTENERFIVPCAFGEKEKFIQAIQGDPQHDKRVQITLPQISFAWLGMQYDAERKQQTTIMHYNINQQKNVLTNYMPVPYNFEYEVYIYVRTIYDGIKSLNK